MPIRIEAELTHIGKAESRTAELFLKNIETSRGTFNANTPPSHSLGEKRGTETVDFPDGILRRQIVFQLTGLTEGINQGTIRFTTRDALAENDEITFTLEVQPPPPLLLVSPPDVHAAFLREALSPSRFRQNGIVPYQIDTLTIAQWEQLSSNEMAKYQATFLLDPPPIPNECWQKLVDYAASGNGVAVILGRNADAATFNKDAAHELLGMTLQMQARNPDGNAWIRVSDKAHPALKPFRDTDLSAWNAVSVYRYWYADKLAAGTSIAMTYSDGRPAMITRAIGQGRVLVMTTPISDLPNETAWNQLPTSLDVPWLFVMLSDGMAQYLLGTGEKNFNYQAGQTAVLRPNAASFPSSCVVYPPTGNAIRVNTDSLHHIITYPAADTPGNYVVAGGQAAGVRQQANHQSSDMSYQASSINFRFPVSGFSVTIPPQTWNLTRMSEEEIQATFGNNLQIITDTPHFSQTASSSFQTHFSRAQSSREFFPILLVLILGVFLMEYAVGNRFYGE